MCVGRERGLRGGGGWGGFGVRGRGSVTEGDGLSGTGEEFFWSGEEGEGGGLRKRGARKGGELRR